MVVAGRGALNLKCLHIRFVYVGSVWQIGYNMQTVIISPRLGALGESCYQNLTQTYQTGNFIDVVKK